MTLTTRQFCVAAAVISVSVSACQSADDATRIVGQLESDRVEIVAEFAEPIVARPIIEGSTVAIGDVLLQLDDRRAQARLKELDAALAQQEARLAELTRGPRQEQISAERANVAGARQELEFRRGDFRRINDIVQKQLAAPEALDRAKAALDGAEAALGISEARLAELLAGTTIEELHQAEGAVAQAEARVENARIDVERHRITAPVAGVVDSVLFEVGERPAALTPAVVLLTGDQPYVRAYVPEALRARVQVSDSAQVHIDGLGEPQDARVRWVASDAAFTPYFALTERDRGHLSYVAKIDLTVGDRADRFPDGLPVEVTLSDTGRP